MLRLLLTVSLLAFAFADVSHLLRGQVQGQQAQILRQEQDISPDGSYNWAYETDNGIQAQEQGIVQQVGKDLATAAQGSFGYTSPEGEQISISYVADANGFQPQGAHLPTPPPIPAAIQRALEWIAAHPSQESQQF